jgi:hypothetical protein
LRGPARHVGRGEDGGKGASRILEGDAVRRGSSHDDAGGGSN